MKLTYLCTCVCTKPERRTSRRLENAALDVNDYDQDYAGDYPTDHDSQAQTGSKTKPQNFDLWHAIVTYFRKWVGGIDEVRAIVAGSCHFQDLCRCLQAQLPVDCALN